jgi:phosphonate transport system ATP-binding protein
MNNGSNPATPTPGVASKAPPIVSVKNVSQSFDGGRIQALRNVSLEVPERQLLVFLGLSGAGKSSLLRLMNGLATPTGGELEVLGVEPNKLHGRALRQHRRRIGFIFQQFHVVRRMSAIENVLNGSLGRLRGPRYGALTYKAELRQQAMEQLERVNLVDQAFQPCGTMSGGQQQRVAIARALFQKPELLLADEPVASLDPETAEQVMDLLFQCCAEDGLTVICSLHQLNFALGWAHRAVGLRAGRVVLDRQLAEIEETDLRAIYQADERDGDDVNSGLQAEGRGGRR